MLLFKVTCLFWIFLLRILCLFFLLKHYILTRSPPAFPFSIVSVILWSPCALVGTLILARRVISKQLCLNFSLPFSDTNRYKHPSWKRRRFLRRSWGLCLQVRMFLPLPCHCLGSITEGHIQWGDERPLRERRWGSAEQFLLPTADCLQHLVVQLLSPVRLFATPPISAHEASLPFVISWSLFRLRSLMYSFPNFEPVHCSISKCYSPGPLWSSSDLARVKCFEF